MKFLPQLIPKELFDQNYLINGRAGAFAGQPVKKRQTTKTDRLSYL